MENKCSNPTVCSWNTLPSLTAVLEEVLAGCLEETKTTQISVLHADTVQVPKTSKFSRIIQGMRKDAELTALVNSDFRPEIGDWECNCFAEEAIRRISNESNASISPLCDPFFLRRQFSLFFEISEPLLVVLKSNLAIELETRREFHPKDLISFDVDEPFQVTTPRNGRTRRRPSIPIPVSKPISVAANCLRLMEKGWNGGKSFFSESIKKDARLSGFTLNSVRLWVVFQNSNKVQYIQLVFIS